MLRVGITGSIAVGKSFVCDVLRELGCPVLDADKTAREVTAPDTEGLKKIVEEFGEGVLNSNRELDREKLGAIVFRNEEKRAILNSIVHPLVHAEQNAWMNQREIESPNGIAVIDAALLIESGGYRRLDKLIVVWCKPEIQISRLMLRNGLSREGALLRINAQMPQEEKKAFADFLIDTSDGFEDTRKQTAEIFDRLKVLAKA